MGREPRFWSPCYRLKFREPRHDIGHIPEGAGAGAFTGGARKLYLHVKVKRSLRTTIAVDVRFALPRALWHGERTVFHRPEFNP